MYPYFFCTASDMPAMMLVLPAPSRVDAISILFIMSLLSHSIERGLTNARRASSARDENSAVNRLVAALLLVHDDGIYLYVRDTRALPDHRPHREDRFDKPFDILPLLAPHAQKQAE